MNMYLYIYMTIGGKPLRAGAHFCALLPATLPDLFRHLPELLPGFFSQIASGCFRMAGGVANIDYNLFNLPVEVKLERNMHLLGRTRYFSCFAVLTILCTISLAAHTPGEQLPAAFRSPSGEPPDQKTEQEKAHPGKVFLGVETL